MKRVKAVKTLGLFGSMACGLALILQGSVVEGVGVITAALSSAGVFEKGGDNGHWL